jgi:predicted transcriptional regulator
MPVDAVIVDRAEVPVYLRIADKAEHLRELGMSDKVIARALGVSDKTVAKAIANGRNR